MTKENLQGITRLAELKIKIDEMPINTLLAIPLTNDFIDAYQTLEKSLPELYREQIDQMIYAKMRVLQNSD